MSIRTGSLALALNALIAVSAQADTIRIGTVQALSGPGASYGQDALAGMELAVSEINAAGGINGNMIELIVRDDEGNPPKGKQLTQQLVYRDNISVFLANTLTTPNLASQEVTVPEGVPHIIAGTTSNVVCEMPGEGERPCPENVFRLAILNSWQGEALVDHLADDLGVKKVAILHDSTEYGQDGFHMLEGPLAERGIEITYVGTFGFGEKNFKPHVLKVQETGAEAVVTWTLDFLVAQIAASLAESGVSKPLLASSATTTFAYRDLAGQAANGTLIADGMPPIVVNPTEKQAELIAAYAAATGKDASAGIQYWTLTYYDAMYWIKDAIERAGGTDRAAIVAALAQSGSFVGAGTGVDYTFSTDQRNGRSPDSIHMVKVQDGQLINP